MRKEPERTWNCSLSFSLPLFVYEFDFYRLVEDLGVECCSFIKSAFIHVLITASKQLPSQNRSSNDLFVHFYRYRPTVKRIRVWRAQTDRSSRAN